MIIGLQIAECKMQIAEWRRVRSSGSTAHATSAICILKSEIGYDCLMKTHLVFLIALLACTDGTEPERIPARMDVLPERTLISRLGDSVQFSALVFDANGNIIPQPFVIWRSRDRSVATIDPNVGLAVAIGAGTVIVQGSTGAILDTAELEVFLDTITAFVPGQSYFGRNNYVEYLAGDLPVVISAPHGGDLTPDEIDDRSFGSTAADANTQELVREIATVVQQRTGRFPHIVISRLHRQKLDPNREIVEAAQGNVFAEHAWEEFHNFIQRAENAVVAQYGNGLYLDLHGHGHPLQRLELGYLLSATDLAQTDVVLDQSGLADQSSIRTLVRDAAATFSALLRGPNSLGTLLEQGGYPSVPSTIQPDPGSDPYFTGGLSTQQHGSVDGAPVSGIQLEAHFDGVRDTQGNRAAFALALTNALETYLSVHYGIAW